EKRVGETQNCDQIPRPLGSTGLATTVDGAGTAPACAWMASYTSCRWTGTSLGATIPSRTLSPRISTTVTVMSLLITILSFFFLDSTSIADYPSRSTRGRGLVLTRSGGAVGRLAARLRR